jgi:Lon protease-like protein
MLVMPSRLIPLFPLQLVVFPRTNLPLHIFEERYKEMTGKAMRENSEFGIVLAKEEGIVNAGCTVSVEKLMHAYPDGRMDIMTRGRNRFEITELNDEQSYLQAEVEFFDDEDSAPAPPELLQRALENFKALLEMGGGREREANLDDPQLSFQLAQTLPDLDFLNALLRHRSETVRLKQLNQYLEQYIPRQRTIEHMKAVAPTNGFGKHAEI